MQMNRDDAMTITYECASIFGGRFTLIFLWIVIKSDNATHAHPLSSHVMFRHRPKVRDSHVSASLCTKFNLLSCGKTGYIND